MTVVGVGQQYPTPAPQRTRQIPDVTDSGDRRTSNRSIRNAAAFSLTEPALAISPLKGDSDAVRHLMAAHND